MIVFVKEEVVGVIDFAPMEVAVGIESVKEEAAVVIDF